MLHSALILVIVVVTAPLLIKRLARRTTNLRRTDADGRRGNEGDFQENSMPEASAAICLVTYGGMAKWASFVLTFCSPT